jgi:transposase
VWNPRSAELISTPPTQPVSPKGDGSNYKDLHDEPLDHAVGRSRGGLSTKVHQLVDGAGNPLVILLGPGNGGDSPVLPHLLDHLQGDRQGSGRPRTRPDAILGDKAYCSRAHRTMLTRRGIQVVIPQRTDQILNRKRRGRRGGRSPAFDEILYKRRNTVERSFNTHKQWRGLATRYDKHAICYRATHVLSSIMTWLDVIGDTP